MPVQSFIENCAIYSMEGLCEQCLPTFRKEKGATKCEKDLTGCIEFDRENRCMQCEVGLTLRNGTCSGIIHCESYNQLNTNNC